MWKKVGVFYSACTYVCFSGKVKTVNYIQICDNSEQRGPKKGELPYKGPLAQQNLSTIIMTIIISTSSWILPG